MSLSITKLVKRVHYIPMLHGHARAILPGKIKFFQRDENDTIYLFSRERNDYYETIFLHLTT